MWVKQLLKIRNFILLSFGKKSHLQKKISCNKKWYGNTYGGFYVCPDLINSESIVYSFGIGEDNSFDNAIIEHHKCPVYAFDPTPKSINWVKSNVINPRFKFYEFGVSNKSGFVDFFLPVNPEYVSGSLVEQKNIDTSRKVRVEMKSVSDIMKELNHSHIDVFKMDIEGSEYDVIESVLNSGIPVTQFLIEFHDRFFEDGNLKTKRAVEQLRNRGYEIFAVSDSLEEVSFLKKSLL